MKRALIAAAFLALSTFTVHAQIDSRGLNKEQEALIQLEIEKLKKRTAKEAQEAVAKPTIDKVNEYAELGQKYGLAIVELAKAIGKSVDDVLNTRVGTIAMILVIWKIIGTEFIGYFFGMIWFAVLMPIWLWSYRRLVVARSYDMVNVGTPEKPSMKVVYRGFSKLEKGEGEMLAWLIAFHFLALVFIVIPGMIILF